MNLSSPEPVSLPASEFPKRADKYLCDYCGRDVSKRFRPGRPHSQAPMGPTRFTCRCGKKYVSGAIEWDHLGDRERRRRIRETLLFGVFFSVMFSIPAGLIYLFFRFLLDLRRAGFLVACIVILLPFALMQATFWPAVVASMWRTRAASGFER